MFLAYEYCKETTFHGLCHIEKEKPYFLRFLYILIFVLGLVTTGFWCYGSLSEYLSRQTSIDYKISSNPYVTSPTLALCSTNRFNRTKVKELNISDDLLEVFHQDMIYTTLDLFVPGVNDSERQEMLERTLPEYQALKSQLGISDHSEITDRLYSRCEDMITKCRDGMGIHIPCCSEAETLEFFSGACVVLPKRQQLNSGYSSGLQLGIKFPTFEELTPAKNGPMTTDVWVFILEHDKLHDISNQHILVERGYSTRIGITKTIFQSVNNPPHFECKSDPGYKPLECFLQCLPKLMSHTTTDTATVCAS